MMSDVKCNVFIFANAEKKLAVANSRRQRNLLKRLTGFKMNIMQIEGKKKAKPVYFNSYITDTIDTIDGPSVLQHICGQTYNSNCVSVVDRLSVMTSGRIRAATAQLIFECFHDTRLHTCLVPRPQYFAAVIRFGSRGPGRKVDKNPKIETICLNFLPS